MKKLIAALILLGAAQVSLAGTYTCPDTMLDENVWNKFEDQLMADKDPNVIINWEGRGGNIDIMLKFVSTMNQMQDRGQKITIRLIGIGASAQAVAPCYADTIIWGPIGVLMYHPLECVDNPNDPYKRCEPAADEFMRTIESACVSKGILSQAQVDQSLDKSEVWVHKSDKDGQYHYIVEHDPRQ